MTTDPFFFGSLIVKGGIFFHVLRLFLTKDFNIVINISFAFVLRQDLLRLLLATFGFSLPRTLLRS